MKYRQPSKIDSTASGMLYMARDFKKKSWVLVKAMRQRIKDNPLNNSQMRLDLIGLEDRWREVQRMERNALTQIEKDANLQGYTTDRKKAA